MTVNLDNDFLPRLDLTRYQHLYVVYMSLSQPYEQWRAYLESNRKRLRSDCVNQKLADSLAMPLRPQKAIKKR